MSDPLIELLCDSIIINSSIRNHKELLAPTLHVEEYYCFLIGRNHASSLPNNRVVIPFRFLARHSHYPDWFLVELKYPKFPLIFWTKSLSILKSKIFELNDKISFLRSCFLWDPASQDFYRLSNILERCIFPPCTIQPQWLFSSAKTVFSPLNK